MWNLATPLAQASAGQMGHCNLLAYPVSSHHESLCCWQLGEASLAAVAAPRPAGAMLCYDAPCCAVICIFLLFLSEPSKPVVPILTLADSKALDGVNLLIPAGKLTALVGLSGSGKSTLVALIQRLYDPNAGQVLINGHDLR